MARVFISYRRVEPDQTIARRIYDHLSADHDVFLDTDALRVGDRWNQKLQKELDDAEYVIALVSLSFLNSPFILEHELRPAVARLKNQSLRGLLHVNLAYDGDPPAEVADVLASIQFAKWRSDADTPRLLETLIRKLPDPQLLIRGARAFGPSDAESFAQLGRRAAIDDLRERIASSARPHVLLHGMSGAGKTSFLVAGVVPALPVKTAVFELAEGTLQELRDACAEPAEIVAFDQFEQVLIRLAADPHRHEAFAAELDVQTGGGRRFLFCIRDEYRTAFERMLPRMREASTTFALLPFAPDEAAVVFEAMLDSGRVEYDEEFVPLLCRELAEGVPRAVLPAILQVIAQQYRARGTKLARASWDEITRGDAVFEEHVRSAILDALPASMSRLHATRTLAALCNGEVKSSWKDGAAIAEESGVPRTHVERTLAVASGRARVVSVDTFTEDAPSRYRLTHDLFVAPIRRLHDLAVRRGEKRRRTAIAVTFALFAIVLGLLWWRSTISARAAQRNAAASDFMRAFREADLGLRDEAALHAARAFHTTYAGDPHRATYALAAMHHSIALGRPVALPQPGRTATRILRSGHIVAYGERGTSISRPDSTAPAEAPPLGDQFVLAVSDDDRWIAGVFAGQKGENDPHILRAGTGERVAWKNAPIFADNDVQFNSDASLLVHDGGGHLDVWSRATGAPLHAGIGNRRTPALAYSLHAPRERVIVRRRAGVELVELRTARVLAQLPTGPDMDAMFSDDGRRVITASVEGPAWILRQWDVASGALLLEQKIAFPAEGAPQIRLHDVNADGTRVLGAGEDNAVFLWNTARRSVARMNIDRFWFAHAGGRTPDGSTPEERLQFALGDTLIVSVSGGNVYAGDSTGMDEQDLELLVKTWSADTFRPWGPVIRVPSDAVDVALSPSASHLLVSLRDNRVLQWDLRKALPRVAALPQRSGITAHAVFSRDGSLVLSRQSDENAAATTTLDILDVRRGRHIRTLTIPNGDPTVRLLHDRFVVSWWIQDDNTSMVQLHDVTTNRSRGPFRLGMRVQSAGVSATGDELRVIASEWKSLADLRLQRVLLDAATGRIVYRRLIPERVRAEFLDDESRFLISSVSTRNVHQFTLSGLDPDRQFDFDLDSGSMGDIDIFKAAVRDARLTFEDDSVTVRRPEGLAFRITRRGTQVFLTNAATAEPILLPRDGDFEDAAFSSDGRYAGLLEAGGPGDKVQVWDLTIGAPVMPPVELATGIAGARFTDEDRAVMVMTTDGVVRRIEVGDRAAATPWSSDLAAVATGKQLDPTGAATLQPAEYQVIKDRLEDTLLKSVPNSDRNAGLVRRWLIGKP